MYRCGAEDWGKNPQMCSAIPQSCFCLSVPGTALTPCLPRLCPKLREGVGGYQAGDAAIFHREHGDASWRRR